MSKKTLITPRHVKEFSYGKENITSDINALRTPEKDTSKNLLANSPQTPTINKNPNPILAKKAPEAPIKNPKKLLKPYIETAKLQYNIESLEEATEIEKNKDNFLPKRSKLIITSADKAPIEASATLLLNELNNYYKEQIEKQKSIPIINNINGIINKIDIIIDLKSLFDCEREIEKLKQDFNNIIKKDLWENFLDAEWIERQLVYLNTVDLDACSKLYYEKISLFNENKNNLYHLVNKLKLKVERPLNSNIPMRLEKDHINDSIESNQVLVEPLHLRNESSSEELINKNKILLWASKKFLQDLVKDILSYDEYYHDKVSLITKVYEIGFKPNLSANKENDEFDISDFIKAIVSYYNCVIDYRTSLDRMSKVADIIDELEKSSSMDDCQNLNNPLAELKENFKISRNNKNSLVFNENNTISQKIDDDASNYGKDEQLTFINSVYHDDDMLSNLGDDHYVYQAETI